MNYPNDNQFEDHYVGSATDTGDIYEVQFADEIGKLSQFGFGLSKKHGVVPKVGQRIRVYGTFGDIIRGVYLDGEKVFYHTAEEQKSLSLREVTKKEARQKQEFEEKGQAAQDYRYAALPPEFQARIEGFRQSGTHFCREFEHYEMFVCEQAVYFATVLKTKEAVITFYKELRAATGNSRMYFPGGLTPDHTGNTLSSACLLAATYLSEPDLVAKQHGALCSLVGCKAYGCYAAQPSKVAEQISVTVADISH